MGRFGDSSGEEGNCRASGVRGWARLTVEESALVCMFILPILTFILDKRLPILIEIILDK
jgi:hypothetical protein